MSNHSNHLAAIEDLANRFKAQCSELGADAALVIVSCHDYRAETTHTLVDTLGNRHMCRAMAMEYVEREAAEVKAQIYNPPDDGDDWEPS